MINLDVGTMDEILIFVEVSFEPFVVFAALLVNNKLPSGTTIGH